MVNCEYLCEPASPAAAAELWETLNIHYMGQNTLFAAKGKVLPVTALKYFTKKISNTGYK